MAKASYLSPDEVVVFLRNLVWAEKLDYLGELLSLEKGEKVSLLAIVGAGHAGVGDMIGWGKEMRSYFFRFYQPFLKDIFENEEALRELCRLTEVWFNPKEGKYEVKRDFLVPDLANLLDPEGRILGKEGQTTVGVEINRH